MPYPSQITLDAIIQTARQMIEERGVDGVSLRGLASELGVKAPSLYRYVANKEALLRAVNEETSAAIVRALFDAMPPDAMLETRLKTIAFAYRRFAHENPAAYELLFTNRVGELRPDEATQEESVLPLQALFAEWGTEENALAALRGAWAFLHGWVMLEIAGQFRRGGDLDEHFGVAFQAYLEGCRGSTIPER